jgi:hypothetical protein
MLQPISFNTAKDITQFLLVVRAKSSSPSILKAVDGNLYLVDDLKKYINQASEQELNASRITFKSADNQFITLAQIKENLDLIQKLEPIDWRNSQYISLWNDKLYADEPFPALNTMEEIKQAKNLYNNSEIHNNIKLSASMLQFARSMSDFAESFAKFPILTPVTSTDVINSMQKDFLKITLIQEAKLKHHLSNQLSHLNTQQEIDSIKQWIKEIEENNSNTKELLQKIIEFLKQHQAAAKAAKTKYSQSNPDKMSEAQARLDALRTNEKTQQQLIDKLVDREHILRNVIANVLFFGLPAVVIMAITVIPAVFISPLLGIGLLILALGLSVGAIFLFGERIASFYSTLPEKLNFSLAKNDIEKLEQIQTERYPLEKDVYFWNEYNKLDADFKKTGCSHEVLIEALESDLKEIKEFEEQLAAPTPSAETQPTPVSAVSIFKPVEADQASTLPTATPVNP